ncbi:MAG: adenylate/guanylate cyclase domain-containing protein [Anaerolineales bacterium]|nr:MAG: adenylate/guanylate cyclase domain-containing protein [Anaerolineales bacterium]
MQNHQGELPIGTVTFLFTDIEGSTRLLAHLGDAYVDLLAEQRRIMREAFGHSEGMEDDTRGAVYKWGFLPPRYV